jgi:hypothetical protein
MVSTEHDRTTIAGGFVRISLGSLMAAWRACQSRPLRIGDFRAWLACHEMVARRCRADKDRAPVYSSAELAKLLGVSPKRARASVRRLVNAGLLIWSQHAIQFPEWPLPDDPILEDSLSGGRGPIFIPRRILRFLAQGAGRPLIATAIALLLRCLSRRRAGFNGRGRLKASWVATVFGVSLRQAKAARMQLIDLGWIEPEDADQWALNRWGRAYRINLQWQAPTQSEAPAHGSSLTPPPAEAGPNLTPPDLQTTIPFGRGKNQDPARRDGGTGIESSGTGTGTKTEDATRPLPAPTLADVRIEDLKDTGRLLGLFDLASDRKLVGSSEADRLKFVALAEHALAIGKENPPGLFAHLLRGGCWRYITQSDEDRANARIKAFLRGPAPPSVASALPRPTKPLLSADAFTVREFQRLWSLKSYQGDPFRQFQRLDPSWTRERWDAALAELRRFEFARTNSPGQGAPRSLGWVESGIIPPPFFERVLIPRSPASCID